VARKNLTKKMQQPAVQTLTEKNLLAVASDPVTRGAQPRKTAAATMDRRKT
jgi:hypothetical protein